MDRSGADTTSATLLNRLVDWRDHRAWAEFVARYDPVIRASCVRYRLDADSTEEFCQSVWIDLARRMRTYRYDPGRTFRGWLRRLCQSRAIDLIRRRKADARKLLDTRGAAAARDPVDDEAEATSRPLLLRQAEEVQARVRRRVDPKTWSIFWSVAVEGRSVRETADAAGLTYYAAFASQKRVGRMLREEGERLLGLADADDLTAEVRFIP